jgi:hypothetical protein
VSQSLPTSGSSRSNLHLEPASGTKGVDRFHVVIELNRFVIIASLSMTPFASNDSARTAVALK